MAVLAAVAVGHLVLAGAVGLAEDEAYYWAWSTRLQAGYYDHPPAIAWLVAAGTAVLGTTELGVRAVPILASTAGIAALAWRARDPVAVVAVLATMPVFALGGVLATPDLPLVAGWAIALRGALDRSALLTGLGVGLAALGKYTGWGLWPLLLAADPRLWRGIPVSLLVASPNLAHLGATGFESLRFQLGHGLDRAPGGAGNFLLAQLGLAGPLLAVVVAAAWARAVRGLRELDREGRVLLATSLPVVAFFAAAATRGAGEANWGAPAFLGAAMLVDRVLPGERARRGILAAAGAQALLCGIAIVHVFTPVVRLERDPAAQLGRGRALAQSVEAWGLEPVYCERYQEAVLLRYYEGLEAWTLPGVGRRNQLDLWGPPAAERALFVRPWRSGSTYASDRACLDRGGAEEVTERGHDGTVSARWQVAEVRGCDPARAAALPR